MLQFNNTDVWGTYICGLIIAVDVLIISPINFYVGILTIVAGYLWLLFRLITVHGKENKHG